MCVCVQSHTPISLLDPPCTFFPPPHQPHTLLNHSRRSLCPPHSSLGLFPALSCSLQILSEDTRWAETHSLINALDVDDNGQVCVCVCMCVCVCVRVRARKFKVIPKRLLVANTPAGGLRVWCAQETLSLEATTGLHACVGARVCVHTHVPMLLCV